MEISQWASQVFHADTLEGKLLRPPGGLRALSDLDRGEAVAWNCPSRPAGLRVAPKEERRRFPKPSSLKQKDMRIRCLHAFCNHELMALELMAWALLAFPQAPEKFRLGLAKILIDEQEHFGLYRDHLAGMGCEFGEIPLNDHFWRVAPDISSPLDWVCTMHLTFEQANLDHAPFYGKLFAEAGDLESAQLMERIFLDEIGHVSFGSKWLKHYKPQEMSTFETFQEHCLSVNTPSRAKGPCFQEKARRQAGLDGEFIDALRQWSGEAGPRSQT